MKIKSMKITLIFFMICLILLSNYVSAANNIVSISSQTVNLNSEFYLILNLSNISFNKFKVEITNTSSLKPTNITSAVLELSNNTGNTSFVIDKNYIGLDKIGIVYTSDREASKINFEVNITNLDKNSSNLETQINDLTTEIAVLNTNLDRLKNSLDRIDETSEEYEKISNEINDLQVSIDTKNKEIESLKNQVSSTTEEKISESISVEVTNVVNQIEDFEDKQQSDKSAWGDMDSMMKDKMKMDMDEEKMSASMKEMMSKMSNLELDLENANNKISSLSTTNIYQGSQNNYLKSLSITGIELKNEFKKTTLDYFATVDKNITNVKVNAVAEDSSSVVTVYGNTDLQEGKNKVIIAVTSEDGSVKNYKIYITK